MENSSITRILSGGEMDISVRGPQTGCFVRSCRFLLWKKIEERNLTKIEFARLCGISNRTLSGYMAGNTSPTLEFICRAALVLRCEVTDLFAPTGWKETTIEGRNSTMMLYDDVLEGLRNNGRTLQDVANASGVSLKSVKEMLACDITMDVNVAYFICTMSGIEMKRLKECTLYNHLPDEISEDCVDGIIVYAAGE